MEQQSSSKGQLIDRSFRRSVKLLASRATIACLVVALAATACRRAAPTETVEQTLAVTVRSEPRTFNRLLATDRVSKLVGLLTMASLVRINAATHEVEPWLAERWTVDATGLVYTLTLRPNLRFADDVPMTAADVVFSAQAAYDPRAGSALAHDLAVDGQPLAFQAVDDLTVRITFPAPYGPGLRLLDALPVLPRHKLAAALEGGTFREAWGLGGPVTEVVGLGPFRLTEYVSGQRMAFARNPHYWRRDASGARLPYLDRLTVEIVPDLNTEMLRLQSGSADIVTGEARPDDLAAVRRLAAQGTLKVEELGVGVDMDYFWFNLSPTRQQAERGRAWLFDRRFRQAVSHAVDRDAFVKTVFLGAAAPVWGPVSPGNRLWHNRDLPPIPFDRGRAGTLLAELGLEDRDGDGLRESRDGRRAGFTLVTQQGHSLRERAATVVQHDLRQVGLSVDIVTLDPPALIARLGASDYDAALFGAQLADTDPATNRDFWLSSGSFHVWNPGQKTPATPWEAEIDDLMRQQLRTTSYEERKRLFDRAQAVFVEHQPVLFFAAPVLHVATSRRVEHATLGTIQPFVLWNADSLKRRP